MLLGARNASAPTNSWRQARPEDLELVGRFLLSRELEAMNLTDRLLLPTKAWSGGAPGPGRPHTTAWWRDWFLLPAPADGTSELRACLLAGSGGFLTCVSDSALDSGLWAAGLGEVRKKKGSFFDELFCLMAAPRDSSLLLPLFRKKNISYQDYRVLVLPPPNPSPAGISDRPRRPDGAMLRSDLLVRKACAEDAEALFPLQCAYEIEEVLVAGQKINYAASRRNLHWTLSKQLVYCALDGERFVAKAGTNALSWHYAQLGGVYTLPERRNRGIAEELVKTLVNDLFGQGYGANLFVKQQNRAALRVYEKLGFETKSDLSIAYF